MSRSITAVRSVGGSLSSACRSRRTRSRCSSCVSARGSVDDRREVRRVDVAVDRLALLADAAVVVDAEIAADADQPGLEVGAAVERVERLVQLEEDVLRQVLGLVVPADELVGDVEDLAPVQADDRFPRRLIAVQAALDELVGRRRRRGRGVSGHGDAMSEKSGRDVHAEVTRMRA